MRTTLIDIINIKKICILQQKKVPTTKKKSQNYRQKLKLQKIPYHSAW